MADTKISALPAATTPLAGTEVLPIVQGGTTDQVSVANLTAGRAVSAASYTPTGATVPTNGIYAPATNATGFTNAGVETFRTTATNSIQIGSASGSTAKIFLYDNNSAGDAAGNAAVVLRQDGTNHIQAWTGSGGNVRGYWTSAGNLVIEDENLVIGTSGKGIDFSATSGSGTSELLADYEEGTWTPGITFGGASAGVTYTSTQGYYTKVGNVVTVSCYINMSNKGSSTGAAQITALPFTCANNAAAYAAPSLFFANLAFAGQVNGYVNINATTIDLFNTSVLGVASALTDTNFANNTGIILNLTYRVA